MNLGVLFFGAYLAVGFVVACVFMLTAGPKARVRSAIGMLGDLASAQSMAFLVFVALWPVWLVVVAVANDDKSRGVPRASTDPGKESASPQTRAGAPK